MSPVTPTAAQDARSGRSRTERDDLVESLFQTEYWRMVGLAQLLVDDREEAEEVVQEAYTRLFASFRRIQDRDRALAYLRSIVLNRARNRLKRRRTARQRAHLLETDVLLADPQQSVAVDRQRVVAAIRQLPTRQADCVVLQYYLDCTEREIAATLGISAGSVKQHLSRARRRLATELGELA